MRDTTGLTLQPQDIEAMILELASHGAWGRSGVWRTTYSPQWVAATDLFARWCTEAGLQSTMDTVGNVWGILPGTEGGKMIVSGSHIDSQCPGGRYDGSLGAIGALVAIRALARHYGPPRRPVAALALCEEEGSRFPTAGFWGSRAITGGIGPGATEEVIGLDGITIGAAMQAVGLDPSRAAEAARDDIAAFIELHIEQGPILELADRPVAVVDAITGIRHSEVTLTGAANHAGAFPMDFRRDPMAGFAEIATGVIDHAHRLGRPAVTTIGRCEVTPNGAAIIPGEVRFTIDARHPDPAAGARMHETHARMLDEIATRRGLGLERKVTLEHPACPCDPGLVAPLTRAAQRSGVPTMQMASGAAHDAQQMAKICPVAMIFVRSKDGRSHTEEEFSALPDIIAGIQVLAGALHELAW